MLGLSATLTEAVFVYLCICICVFACQTPGNIVFEVLVPVTMEHKQTLTITQKIQMVLTIEL